MDFPKKKKKKKNKSTDTRWLSQSNRHSQLESINIQESSRPLQTESIKPPKSSTADPGETYSLAWLFRGFSSGARKARSSSLGSADDPGIYVLNYYFFMKNYVEFCFVR